MVSSSKARLNLSWVSVKLAVFAILGFSLPSVAQASSPVSSFLKTDKCSHSIPETGWLAKKDYRGLPRWPGETNPTLLDSELVSLPTHLVMNAVHSIRVAEFAYRRLAKLKGFKPHNSKTHSWEDVMIQALSVIWSIPDPNVQELIAFMIMALHSLDDIADNSAIDYLSRRLWRFRGLFNSLMEMDSSMRIDEITEQLINLAKFTRPQFRNEKLIHFGIRRILMGAPIFKGAGKISQEFTAEHRIEVLVALPISSRLSELIRDNRIHPFTVALSIKPVYEVIDAIAEDQPHILESMLKSMFLGGLVYSHNSRQEVAQGEVGVRTHLSRELYLEDLNKIAELIKAQPLPRRKRIIQNFVPIIETSAGPLRQNGLLDFYLEFIRDPKIKPHLPPEIMLDVFFIKMELKSQTGREPILPSGF